MELSTDDASSFESHYYNLYKLINNNLDVKLVLDKTLQNLDILICGGIKIAGEMKILIMCRNAHKYQIHFFIKKLLFILKHVKCDLNIEHNLL